MVGSRQGGWGGGGEDGGEGLIWSGRRAGFGEAGEGGFGRCGNILIIRQRRIEGMGGGVARVGGAGGLDQGKMAEPSSQQRIQQDYTGLQQLMGAKMHLMYTILRICICHISKSSTLLSHRAVVKEMMLTPQLRLKTNGECDCGTIVNEPKLLPTLPVA